MGSIYNYFQNKSSLIAAAIESVWCDIFHMPENRGAFESFTECVESAYESMQRGNEKYPEFFPMHSMSFIGENKTNGQLLMEKSWRHIKAGFYTVLMQDKKVDHSIFNNDFTPQKFVILFFDTRIIASAGLRQLWNREYDQFSFIQIKDFRYLGNFL